MNETRRAPRGLVVTAWVVSLVVFVATLAQVAVWAMIWWLGGSAIVPFWEWTLGAGGVVVLALIAAVFVAGRLPGRGRSERPVSGTRVPRSEELL
ncbi:hypothetical protein CLV46_0157 [Diaminobutyricimonas aerilata]|uniref:Uncharacterized protein n=1 Tax=Diaminobutyricimonas aerilata TaxID=1162967 RepID=A0A2M9CFL4_9MICO|nr:hypothetical protein [Diaminobutyricimonas aerilata]PJJ70635.1 hypothetical protein CLV46_0157 [Diaminobutyricimonas aerilata]